MDLFSSTAQANSGEHLCLDTHCAVSFISYVLLLFDSYFDITFILNPTKENAASLRSYYKLVLTPSLSPLPWPGYSFPPYTIYKMCYECPNVYFLTLSALWLLLSVRYHRILRDTDDLKHWWSVVLIRVVMAILLALNLGSTRCQLSQNIPRFLGLGRNVFVGLPLW